MNCTFNSRFQASPSPSFFSSFSPPEFSPTEPPDHHHKYIQQLPPAHPPSRPSATLLDYQPPYSSHDSKLPLTSHTDMSATRYVGQASKRSPQPKAEVSSSSVSKGSSRGNDTGVSSLDRNRNDHIRGNQGAGFPDSMYMSGGGAEKKAKPVRKVVNRDGSSNQWNDHKNRSRDVGLMKLPSPTTAIHPPVVATRGVSSNSSASFTHSKTETTSNDSKTQSHAIRGKAPAKQSAKGHRSNQTPSESAQRDPSPSSSSVGSSANEYNYSSSTKAPADSSWNETIYPSTPVDKHPTPSTSALPSGNSSANQKPSLYEEKEEYMWNTSQESDATDWGAEADLEEQLLWSSSTDDDKINYSELLWLQTHSKVHGEGSRPVPNWSHIGFQKSPVVVRLKQNWPGNHSPMQFMKDSYNTVPVSLSRVSLTWEQGSGVTAYI